MGFGTATLAYPLELITKNPPVKEAGVDSLEIDWNRIEDYIWKWYPILQNKANYAYPVIT